MAEHGTKPTDEKSEKKVYRVSFKYDAETYAIVGAESEDRALELMADAFNDDVSGFEITGIEEVLGEERQAYEDYQQQKQKVLN